MDNTPSAYRDEKVDAKSTQGVVMQKKIYSIMEFVGLVSSMLPDLMFSMQTVDCAKTLFIFKGDEGASYEIEIPNQTKKFGDEIDNMLSQVDEDMCVIEHGLLAASNVSICKLDANASLLIRKIKDYLRSEFRQNERQKISNFDLTADDYYLKKGAIDNESRHLETVRQLLRSLENLYSIEHGKDVRAKLRSARKIINCPNSHLIDIENAKKQAEKKPIR